MSSKNCTECHGTGWLDSEGEPVEVARGASALPRLSVSNGGTRGRGE